jgi:hypothetical protein
LKNTGRWNLGEGASTKLLSLVVDKRLWDCGMIQGIIEFGAEAGTPDRGRNCEENAQDSNH